jgi:hypothetical protein
MNPKVSLIMTVYNREQYLEEAIAFLTKMIETAIMGSLAMDAIMLKLGVRSHPPIQIRRTREIE